MIKTLLKAIWNGCSRIRLLTAKISLALVITSASGVNAATTQESLITLQLENTDFGTILKEIRKKTDYKFIYQTDWFDKLPLMSVDVKDATLSALLDKLIVPYNFEYEIVDSTVIFKRGENASSTPTVPREESTARVTITGSVADEAGSPLPGVNVIIKGTTRGTTTDAQGQYAIDANSDEVLVFSFIGFTTQEIRVGNQTTINVTLLPNVQALNEVVVTGYGDVAKSSYTGASQSLSIDEVQIKGVGDVSQMLQGRAAGVSVQNVSGTFGAGPRITIRGGASILGDGTPLWVIDGVVQEDIVSLSVDDLVSGNASTLIGSSVASLNPNDIESFEILKDASAHAIYGSRSLNGVIVIKTKRGRRDTPLSVTYSGEFTTRDIPTYGDADILDSKENFSILQEFKNKGRLDITTISQSCYSAL